MNNSTMRVVNFQAKIDSIAAQIRGYEGVVREELRISRSEGRKRDTIKRQIREAVEQGRAEMKAETLTRVRREQLESNNIFTLIGLYYENPMDVEVLEAVNACVARQHLYGMYSNEVLYNFLFTIGNIHHELVVFPEFVASHQTAKNHVAELPREREVYAALKKFFGSK